MRSRQRWRSRSRLRGAPLAHAAATTTREAALQPYVGARWTEAAARLRDAGFDLAAPFDRELVPPWDAVEKELALQSFVDESDVDAHRKNATLWNDDLAFDEVDFAAERYDPRMRPLDASDRDFVPAIRDRYEAALADMGAEAGALFVQAMESVWAKGRIEKYPLVPLQPPESEMQRVRALRMINMSNWYVLLVLRTGEALEYEEALNRVKRLKAQRFAEVREYPSGR